MLLELLAVAFAGLAGGGVASLARRLLRALPGWLVPVAAGGAMLAVAISLEYAWFDRTRAALPPHVEVAIPRESRAPWRPWTYLAPFVDGFVAVDGRSVRTHPAKPDQRIVNLLVFGRWAPVRRVPAAFDCAAGRRADLVEGATLGPGGAIGGASWRNTGLDDPVTRLACAAPEAGA